MPSRHPRRTLLGHAATALAGLIVVGALVILAVSLVAAAPSDEHAASRSASARDDPNALHVGGPSCRDDRTPEQARNAATPWCTPSRALSAAPPGAVVELAPGNYPPLSVGRETQAGPPLTLRGAPGGRSVMAGLDVRQASGLRVRGIAFRGPVTITNASRIALDRNDLRGAGIVVTVSRQIALTRNHVHDVHGETRGIYLRGDFRPGRPDNEDIVIRDNRIERLDHDGLAVYNGYRNVRVEDNTISRVVQPEGFAKHSDGMQFMGGRNLVVRGNVVRDTSKEGMLFKDGEPSRNLVVTGNVIFDIAGPGLQVYSAPGARIARNTVWGTKLGSFIGNDPAVPGPTRAALSANVFDRLTLLNPGVVARAGGNLFGTGKPVGRPAYRGRPNFEDARGGDLRISRGRPGARMPGHRRPPGAQRDIG